MMKTPRLMAFDLDGTLAQHKTPLGEKNRSVLERLSKKYKLLMVGAGTCTRIFNQLGKFPIDIIGNYGMQYGEYNAETGEIEVLKSENAPVDREEVLRRAEAIREKYNLHEFKGETLEFHPTGALTFPVLGTKADIADKLAYDPDRSKRRVMYEYVCNLFHDYRVVIGGSSSFDIIPGEYGKYNALMKYLEERGMSKEDVVYCGDDYMEGGNDHDVLAGGIPFVKVDNYEMLEELLIQEGLL
ncbi:MAG: HAD-IIB family hydrolase [Clostridia bacterium]|nr:HAD-IIB family hydrolase [Clostridia bacterium]